MITKEYPTVLKRSRNREALEAVNDALVTEELARHIIYAHLWQHHLTVRFTGRTGRGYCGYRKDKRVRSAWIRLPAESTGKLTLGLTLHELAHAKDFLGRKARGHGPQFSKTLDDLIEQEWISDEACYWHEMETA